jgi:hypothetical protein
MAGIDMDAAHTADVNGFKCYFIPKGKASSFEHAEWTSRPYTMQTTNGQGAWHTDSTNRHHCAEE